MKKIYVLDVWNDELKSCDHFGLEVDRQSVERKGEHDALNEILSPYGLHVKGHWRNGFYDYFRVGNENNPANPCLGTRGPVITPLHLCYSGVSDKVKIVDSETMAKLLIAEL